MRKVSQNSKMKNTSYHPSQSRKLAKKAATIMSAWFLSASLLAACSPVSSATSASTGSASTAQISTTAVTTAVKLTSADLVTFKDSDYTADWSSADSTMIKLNGSNIAVTGSGAAVSGSTITITTAGTYVISGELTDGQVVVNSTDEGDMHIVLNGVSLTNNNNAPILIQEADHVIMTLQEGTENTVTDGAEYVFADDAEVTASAAIFSKADLTINGTGTLNVNANYNDAITSKDDLKIVSGTFNIQSADDGIVSKDMLAIADGTFTIHAGGDGLKSTNDEDTEKGFIAIQQGTFNITAANDGIQAETRLVIDNGTYNIITAGGSSTAEAHTESAPPGGMGSGGTPPDMNGERPTPPADTAETKQTADAGQTQVTAAADTTDTGDTSSEEEASTSAKALKAGGDLVINNGTYEIDAQDDSVHSNSGVTIAGGIWTIATGDDGIHADGDLNITGGNIKITESYEGLEGTNIHMTGGDVHVTASDDGVNASAQTTIETDTATSTEDTTAEDGTPQSGGFGGGPGTVQDASLHISGGTLYVDASGDGLDSNGTITMTGGTVVVNGPVDNGNGALDYDGTFEMTGGHFIAAGSSGMMQAPSEDSSQYSIAMTYSAKQTAGTLIHLQDSEGNDILTFAPAKDYQSVVISSPELEKGSNYTLYAGGTMSGTAVDGLYTDGTYSGGTEVVSFELSSSVTWLSESGVSTSNPNSGFGGGRPQRNTEQKSEQSTTDTTN